MALTKAGAMVKNLRVKKKTPAWIVAARNDGSTTLQDPLRFTLLRGGGGGGKGAWEAWSKGEEEWSCSLAWAAIAGLVRRV